MQSRNPRAPLAAGVVLTAACAMCLGCQAILDLTPSSPSEEGAGTNPDAAPPSDGSSADTSLGDRDAAPSPCGVPHRLCEDFEHLTDLPTWNTDPTPLAGTRVIEIAPGGSRALHVTAPSRAAFADQGNAASVGIDMLRDAAVLTASFRVYLIAPLPNDDIHELSLFRFRLQSPQSSPPYQDLNYRQERGASHLQDWVDGPGGSQIEVPVLPRREWHTVRARVVFGASDIASELFIDGTSMGKQPLLMANVTGLHLSFGAPWMNACPVDVYIDDVVVDTSAQ